MSTTSFFPPHPSANPKTYVYSIDASNRKGLLKVGYTVRDAAARMVDPSKQSKQETILLSISLKL